LKVGKDEVLEKLRLAETGAAEMGVLEF